MVDVCAGIKHMEDCGVVHMDPHVGNILVKVSANGRILGAIIIDFDR